MEFSPRSESNSIQKSVSVPELVPQSSPALISKSIQPYSVLESIRELVPNSIPESVSDTIQKSVTKSNPETDLKSNWEIRI